MKLYQYTDSDLTSLANQIKETVIQGLKDEGVLEESVNLLCARYVVVATETSAFGKFWNKVRGIKDANALRLVFLKTTDSIALKEKEEEQS